MFEHALKRLIGRSASQAPEALPIRSPYLSEAARHLEGGGPSFWSVVDIIKATPPPTEDVGSLQDLVAYTIVETVARGMFNDLGGARELMNALGLESLAFSDEMQSVLKQALAQTDLNVIYSLGVSQEGLGGDIDLESARVGLRRGGYRGDLSDDEAISRITRMRGLLWQLHERQHNGQLNLNEPIRVAAILPPMR